MGLIYGVEVTQGDGRVWSGTEGCEPSASTARVPEGGRWMRQDGQKMTGCSKDPVKIPSTGRKWSQHGGGEVADPTPDTEVCGVQESDVLRI